MPGLDGFTLLSRNGLSLSQMRPSVGPLGETMIALSTEGQPVGMRGSEGDEVGSSLRATWTKRRRATASAVAMLSNSIHRRRRTSRNNSAHNT